MATSPNDTELKKNAKAPFAGVLVGEKRYRMYQEGMQIKEVIKEVPCLPCEKIEPLDNYIFAAGGVAVGVSATLIIIALTKN